MDVNTAQYYNYLQEQLNKMEEVASAIELHITKTDDAELAETDYSEIANETYKSILGVERQLVTHKIVRMDKEAFLRLLNGETIDYAAKTVHNVTTYDTLRSIASKYGVTVDEILMANGITTAEFEEQTELIIPLKQTSARTIFPNVLTYGSHEGIKVLGKDIAMTGDVDSEGDLKTLDEASTFEQGMLTLITTSRGDIAFDESYGAAPTIGKEYPPEAIMNMLTIDFVKALDQDERISDIDDLQIERQNNTAWRIRVNVLPINSNDYKKIVSG